MQNILPLIVFGVIFVSFLLQLYYYLFIFYKIGLKRLEKTPEHIDKPISVILCIKNESKDLSKILPLILEQNYPEYEVIVVNDNSTDDSKNVLKLAQTKYPRLQIRNLLLNNNFRGKSVVLGIGIKAAKYDWITMINTACRPSANWLKSISTGFESDIVVGYTRYSAASKFVRITNYYESLFRLGYALNKKPYTASGENESFRKKLFFEKGFNPLLRKPEKVEQVFFNSVMNKKNTSVVLLREAIVDSKKSLSFDEWCLECSGELFSRRLFRKGSRHRKSPEIISRTLFYLSIASAIIMTANDIKLCMLIVGIFLLRLSIQIFVFHSTQKALGENKLIWNTLLWDFYSIAVYLYVAMLIRHRKAIKYK
ncbi:MAG: glycosyltransferase [Prevotellaceae bacterium]|nr:glycosyltransferase [Prevotellaceae bacterium]